ncbi:uncharacterized protein E0L32_009126 [Thyridium curvatum]|uniref:Dolichyldiphosphatase n=1 Tax=Thyridium curvatum TaxID=1093900 RepID=A0A507APF4_9PEZI|nr:uncharacterized protein E0L32_009126 [Thyridium curvatum]TPX09653.1 hypothetical protein E0L32_009126 [Thyridium curvatum]
MFPKPSMDDSAPLASLSLTHVYYDPSDPVSYLCAWLALVPQALCIVYATLIWSSREAEVALMFAGQLACEAANFALKRLIKEERPAHRAALSHKGYGMPSSHAQFVAFWAVALALFLLARHKPRPFAHRSAAAAVANGNGNGAAAGSGRRAAATTASIVGRAPQQLLLQAGLDAYLDPEAYAHRPWSFLERALASLAAFVLAALVAWSRTYLGYHTTKQVLVGAAAGTACALAWFAATAVARRAGLLSWALDLPVARWFRMRDLVVEEDLCHAGWEKWEDKKIAMQEKKAK